MKIYSGSEGPTILLIRPGATEFDEQGRIVGTLNVPLSELGVQQANELSSETAQFELKAIFSSPSAAAIETAEIIGQQHKLKVKVKDALQNIDMGLWQGKEIKELRKNQPKVAKQWEEHPETVCPPEGESFEDVIPRVQKFLQKLRKKHRTGTIVIVVANPLAKVIAAQLSAELEGAAAQSQGQSAEEFAACGQMELLPLEIGLADALAKVKDRVHAQECFRLLL